jgi:hypothetical protein
MNDSRTFNFFFFCCLASLFAKQKNDKNNKYGKNNKKIFQFQGHKGYLFLGASPQISGGIPVRLFFENSTLQIQ